MDFFSIVPAHVCANPAYLTFVDEAVHRNVFAQFEPWRVLEPMLDCLHDTMVEEDVELLDWVCEFVNEVGFRPNLMSLQSREYLFANVDVVQPDRMGAGIYSNIVPITASMEELIEAA